jgi:hypothetical protein
MSRNLNENAGILLEMEAESPQMANIKAGPGIRQPAGAKWSLPRVITVLLLISGILGLGWCSFSLASMRIYQVDECINVFVAHMIKTGQSAPGMDLFQVIISWLTPLGGRAADLFSSARVVTLMIFWLNLILLAMATGERILSPRWLVALLGAATLAPLWDYGFEVRHDNLLLTGIFLMWGMVRFQPPRLGAFIFLGACFVGVEFVSIKAILYTFPITLGIFVFPPPGERPARWKLFAGWCVGAVVAFVALRLVFKFAGLSQDYLANVKGAASVPTQALRFWPIPLTLPRLLTQTPLLVAMVIAAVITCGASIWRDKRAALNWDGILPEVLLLGIALTALFTNPNPYPYNLLHVVPYMFLLAFRYGAALWKQLPRSVVFAPVALSVVLFTHVVPFAVATHRHWLMPNYPQERLMNLTEDLTDAQKDSVFDGIGMVPTRNLCDVRSLIHGQVVKSFVDGTGPHIRDLLAANPPSVVILSYRTDWLPEEDHDFFNERYVSIGDDFMVLGKLLPAGGGTFQVYHAGKYRITSAEGSNIIGTYALPKDSKDALAKPKEEPPLKGSVDGVPLNGRPVELSVGTHRIDCASDQKAAVAWVGPHLNELPRLAGDDHHRLFVNWY